MTDSKDQWEATQKKTFTKWFNNHLTKKHYPPIDDAQNDFETGIKLMQIVNALYDIPIPKHNSNPKLRANKLDNIELALKMVDQAKIKTNFLKHTHLVDKDLKMILGMMWAIILNYAITGISEEEMTAKEGLLLWCRKKTTGYNGVDPPGINNFTSSWRSGLALCALIHRHQPALIDYESLSPNNPAENIKLAFDVAEKQLNIPRLLDVEDLLQEKPDERSVMTYVAEYFHRFATQDAKEQSARRALKFAQFIRGVNEKKGRYEQQTADFIRWVDSVISEWESEPFGTTLEESQAVVDRLRTFVLEDEPKNAALKLDIEALYAEIQTELKVNGRAPYAEPQEASPDALEDAYHRLYTARQVHARKARDHRFTFIKKEETQIAEDQLAEFASAFKHFDTDRDHVLNKSEFKAAASAVGVSMKDDAALTKVFNKVSEGASGVNEEQYIRYMRSLAEDKDSPEQVKASFRQLGNDSDTISPDALNVPPMSADDVAYLVSIMPKAANGQLDYNAFVDQSFAS